MAGAIVTTAPIYNAGFPATQIKSFAQRFTITTVTDADALDTAFDLPAGSMVLSCAMKVISGCDKTSTISVGWSGTAAGLLGASSIAAAANGTTYYGTGTSTGVGLGAAKSVLLTAAVTAGPATTNTVVDLEIIYIAAGLA